MMMNEFEILEWTVFIEKVDLLSKSQYGLEETLLFLALAAKSELNELDTINIFQSYFTCHMEGFIHRYNIWLSHHGKILKANMIEVNAHFKELNKPYNPGKE